MRSAAEPRWRKWRLMQSVISKVSRCTRRETGQRPAVPPPVAVCIDGNLLGVFTDPVQPLVKTPVEASMCSCAIGFAAARDQAESQRYQEEDYGPPHIFSNRH
jgi:hypothetical protein